MATFAKTTFNTAIYAASRPTYPRQLFDFVFKYHERSKGARWDTAVDLGCGTGQATTELTPFKRVIGIDPSQKMIDDARKHTDVLLGPGAAAKQFEYIQSPAEDLRVLKDGSVDLMVAAQAAHWFDWAKVWPEAARVLRKGGSGAFWIYSEFRLTHHPSLTPLITTYAQGTDHKTSLGPHWQRPGRTIVEQHLSNVPEADKVVPGVFTDWERVYFTGNYYPDLPAPRPVILRKAMQWSDLLEYFHSWSSLHTYHEKFPDDLTREDGDISLRFWKELKEGVKKEGGKVEDSDQVEVEWPVAMILVKRA